LKCPSLPVTKERKELLVSQDKIEKHRRKLSFFFTEIPNPKENEQSDSESTSETSDSDSSSDSSESENENTEEYLESVLQKSLQNAKAAEKRSSGEDPDEEDVIVLEEKTLRYTHFLQKLKASFVLNII